LYLQFKSEDSDVIWSELIRRAALADRRTARVATPVNRRRSDREQPTHHSNQH
jgi:hypothetical protein